MNLRLSWTLLFFLLYLPFSTWIDLSVTKFFYKNDQFSSFFLWEWLYRYGIWPGWGLFLLGLFWILFQDHQKRRAGLYLVLTLAIGGGLIVHALFKDHWGRPRPKQTILFGGTEPFYPFFYPRFDTPFPAKSFPCGHCTMGYYFLALIPLGRYWQSKFLLNLGYFIGLPFGSLIGLARIAQGGHFFSDVIFSAWIMWQTAECVSYALFRKEKLL